MFMVVTVTPLGQPLQVVFQPVVSTSLNGVAVDEHASDDSDSTGATTSVVSMEGAGLFQVVIELVQRETAMTDAQTGAKGLPPMPH